MLARSTSMPAGRMWPLGFALPALACASILGIEDRKLRPDVDGGPSGSGGVPASSIDGGVTAGRGNVGGAGTGGSGAVDCANISDPCSQCACNACTDLFANCVASGADCEGIAACVATSGCTDPMACQTECGSVAASSGAPPEFTANVGACFQGCSCVPNPPPVDELACQQRYGAVNDGATYNLDCTDCLCSSCSPEVVRMCGQPGVDCDAVARCMQMTGCRRSNECSAPTGCADVISRSGLDPATVDALGDCVDTCSACGDFTASSDTRSVCADFYGGYECAPCICNSCPLDLISQCDYQVDCGTYWDCLATSGCSGTACLDACVTPGIPAAVHDALLQCAIQDCSSCALATWQGVVTGEVCNFVDDDGDGVVDNGFPWQLQTWTVVTDLPDQITDLKVREIPNTGNVAVTGLYGQVGQSSPFVMIASADGTPVSAYATNPAFVTGYGVDADAMDVAAVFSTDTCTPSCLTQTYQAYTTDNNIQLLSTLAYSYSNLGIFDVAKFGTVWLTASLDPSGQLEFSWIGDGTQPGWAPDLPYGGPWGTVGSISRRNEWAVGVFETVMPVGVHAFAFDLVQGEVRVDVPLDATVGAMDALAEGRSVAFAAGTAPATGPSFVVLYSDAGTPSIVRVAGLADVVEYGPANPSGQTPVDVIEVGGNFVTLARDAAQLTLDRFTDTLEQPYPEMRNMQVPPPSPDATRMAFTGTNILVFNANGPSLEVAQITCP